MKESLNIHAVLPRSRVNGPGSRLVVFFQGCNRGCDGCFNPGTHSLEEREVLSPEGLFEKYLTGVVEGLTISGGEPFLQPRGLSGLLEAARSKGLSTLVYTGFTLEEIKKDPGKAECLGYIDVLIDSPFERERPERTLLARGSENQRIHLLTSRYTLEDLYMPGRVEVIIGADGNIRKTGFSNLGVS